MVDTLKVFHNNDEELHFFVLSKQSDMIVDLLHNHKISCWADEFSISTNGEPHVTVINISHGVNVDVVQNILDKII